MDLANRILQNRPRGLGKLRINLNRVAERLDLEFGALLGRHRADREAIKSRIEGEHSEPKFVLRASVANVLLPLILSQPYPNTRLGHFRPLCTPPGGPFPAAAAPAVPRHLSLFAIGPCVVTSGQGRRAKAGTDHRPRHTEKRP